MKITLEGPYKEGHPQIMTLTAEKSDNYLELDGNEFTICLDGCGGWGGCSNQRAYGDITKEEAIQIVDYLQKYVIGVS